MDLIKNNKENQNLPSSLLQESLLSQQETLNYEGDVVSKSAFENFGIKYLYPWQRLVIGNILEAYDYYKYTQTISEEESKILNTLNHDSFCKGRQIVLLPTGAGKSLCFQIPALLLDGPSLIVYPLLALMTDQQRRMQEGSLRSVVFRGGQSREERRECFDKIKNGAKIILANPEVLESEELLLQLKKVGIKHIAIDEAHTVSEWGLSFRPSYLNLGKVIEQINPPIVTAFTATASPDVLAKVSEILFQGSAHIVRSESDRQNIHYFVKYAAIKKKAALKLIASENKPMIIFCGTRGNAQDMAMEINACFGKALARYYHAGLTKNEKDEIEKWFYESKDGVLCATCAYGMGVDKKDIKTVLHIEASPTAEAYIQEAGRGGRDGSVAKAILLWSLQDSHVYSVFKKGSREAAMYEFAITKDCRRQVLLDALGGEQAVCSGCDLCNERIRFKDLPHRKINRIKNKENDIDWQFALNIIKKNKNVYNILELTELLNEKMNAKFRSKIGVNAWNNSDSVDLISQLITSGKVKVGKFLWKGRLKALNNPKQ